MGAKLISAFFFSPLASPLVCPGASVSSPLPLNFRPVTLSNQIRQTEEGRGTELRRLFEAGPTEPRLSLVVACSAVGGSGRRPRKDVCRDETRGQRERRVKPSSSSSSSRSEIEPAEKGALISAEWSPFFCLSVHHKGRREKKGCSSSPSRLSLTSPPAPLCSKRKRLESWQNRMKPLSSPLPLGCLLWRCLKSSCRGRGRTGESIKDSCQEFAHDGDAVTGKTSRDVPSKYVYTGPNRTLGGDRVLERIKNPLSTLYFPPGGAKRIHVEILCKCSTNFPPPPFFSPFSPLWQSNE